MGTRLHCGSFQLPRRPRPQSQAQTLTRTRYQIHWLLHLDQSCSQSKARSPHHPHYLAVGSSPYPAHRMKTRHQLIGFPLRRQRRQSLALRLAASLRSCQCLAAAPLHHDLRWRILLPQGDRTRPLAAGPLQSWLRSWQALPGVGFPAPHGALL